MFRRRTSSPCKIHYRVNINKNMCLGVVDIYIDGKPYQLGFNGSYLDNSGMHCELANKVIYGNRITNFVPVTVIKDPGKIINFTYRSELQTQVLDESYVSWDGDYVLNDNCIVTDLCSGCESYAYGKSSRGNYRVTVRIV